MGKPRPSRRISQEEIIRQFRDVHGDRYDYSKVEYTGIDNRVTIICSEHGEFTQTPYSHRKGSNCGKCSGRGLSNEDWIERFRSVHGDKFDYSKVDYKGSDNKVTITCREHGDWGQTPHSHLSGNGCPKCSGRGKTTSEWVMEAKSIHGDRFDYSLTQYIDTNTKVTITCNEHGNFDMLPGNHTHKNRPQGCPKCSRSYSYNTAEWIAKSIDKFGERFDYSETEYTGAVNKLKLICDIHGEIDIIANRHLMSPTGCTKCSNEQTGMNQRRSQKDVIAAYREKHGDKFDYSKVEYRGAYEPVTIICPQHGEYEQRSMDHERSRYGCNECAKILDGFNRRLTQEQVIARAIQVHGDWYDYSKVEYKTIEDPITIICPEHGEFVQQANHHINQGSGCNECAIIQSGLNRRLTREEVIERAVLKHGNKYDYSKFEYNTIMDNATIICPIHGEFSQMINVHINKGAGCAECGRIESGLKRRISAGEWLDRFEQRHGQMYDYSLCEFESGTEKISIICSEHGIFEQRPKDHGKGQGCPKCLKKNQTKVFEFVKEIFPNEEVLFDYKHPELRFEKSNVKMELDIWLPNLSLGIEYQGEQHYEEFWQGNVELSENQTLNGTLARDEEKRIACANNGITLIEIPYTWNSTIDYVMDALSLHGIEFEMI